VQIAVHRTKVLSEGVREVRGLGEPVVGLGGESRAEPRGDEAPGIGIHIEALQFSGEGIHNLSPEVGVQWWGGRRSLSPGGERKGEE
jgi:hypothetical protein